MTEYNEKNGGPAYPTAGVSGVPYFPGMTLRDYFAAQVLGTYEDIVDPEQDAKWAYTVADAMLAERDK